MKEDYQKPLKKPILFFLPNPVSFNVQSYQKKKGLGASDQSLFMLRNKFRIPLLVIYLSDQVWWCNMKQLLSYFKNYFCKFMQANSWHHKLLHFHLSFCIWNAWKGREKIQNLEYLENEKSFLHEIKHTFHSFSRDIIWWKNKKLMKNSGHKLQISSCQISLILRKLVNFYSLLNYQKTYGFLLISGECKLFNSLKFTKHIMQIGNDPSVTNCYGPIPKLNKHEPLNKDILNNKTWIKRSSYKVQTINRYND